MRVVAGSARGRKLTAPPGEHVRPTTDRVREAVFNALTSMGAITDEVVLDLFAGSGALGIEALSRGAAKCTFVEPDRAARDCLTQNLAALDFTARATVESTTAAGYLARSTATFDLVLCDPPYTYDDWAALWELLGPRVATDGIVVVESGQDLPAPAGWTITRHRRYGGTVVTVLTRPAPESAPAGVPH